MKKLKLCVKDLVMNVTGVIEATAGKTYEFTESDRDGMLNFTNNSGNEFHYVPVVSQWFVDMPPLPIADSLPKLVY